MKKIVPILILLTLIIPIGISAATTTGPSISILNPIAASSTAVIIDNIISLIFYVGLVVTPLMIVIAGFLILTAGGDPKKVEQGRHIIIYTLIGLFIILFAKAIVSMLNKVMGI
ncbi:MAG: hypothetical protein NTZ84_01880 [Candidatus Nealsonbacteria bacterium]|nr:hypothetical protein [Candidatus Nealsonbacteria bacterium]